MKYISLLGSTGSIGQQALDIVASHPQELKVVALAAGAKQLSVLVDQITRFAPDLVSVPTAEDAKQLSSIVASSPSKRGPEILYGDSGLEAVATHPRCQTVVTGVVGFLGLKPTIAAIKAGKTIGLANKETLVSAGCVVMPLAREKNVQIVPIDSEHSAIFQSLADTTPRDERRNQIAKILLTGSGGPFRTWTKEQLKQATISDALKHPNWSMGKKITIDSATLMNKGLEIIEARWLFEVQAEQIQVVIHPQSILHSAVEFTDGSIVGQFGLPDMRLPIHYALFFPQRVRSERVPKMDFTTIGQLSFENPDLERFPCLAMAKEIACEDTTLPCVLNAANEVIVERFLAGALGFTEIPELIKRVLDAHKSISSPNLDDIFESDRWARREAYNLSSRLLK